MDTAALNKAQEALIPPNRGGHVLGHVSRVSLSLPLQCMVAACSKEHLPALLVDLERPALFALLCNCTANGPDQPRFGCPCRETAHWQLQ
jgi:hypothetical protein